MDQAYPPGLASYGADTLSYMPACRCGNGGTYKKPNSANPGAGGGVQIS